MKKLPDFSKTRRCKDIRTKVDVQEGCVGSLHQDLLGRTMESLIHEVHAVPHHGLDLLRVVLKPTQETSLPQFLRAILFDVLTFNLASSPSTSISRVGYMDMYCLANILYLEAAASDQ